MRKNVPIHRPPHVYLDETEYVVTASTLGKAHYLATDAHLRLWVSTLHELCAEFAITVGAWVVLPNHYHLLFASRRGRDIGRFIGRLNGRTSHDLNQMDGARGRHVWYNYWDSCIRTEVDHWTHFNYIHNNPVKHGYARRPEDWEFSTYRYYLETKGEEWLAGCFLDYPVKDHLEGDSF